MKQVLILFSILLFSIISSCSKECVTANKTCNETVETGLTTCAAYFESYFYDKENNKCLLQGYSGCSEKGFATKEECEACICNN